MSEKFVTPKTNLREAINNASGPVALSNRVLLQFAPISFLLVLVSNPSRLSGSYIEWLLVATVGLVATVAVLLLFRATVLPSKPGRKPRILMTSVAYTVAGLARGTSVYLTGAALGIMPAGEFIFRLIGGPLFVYGAISMLAIFNASRIRHEKTLAELEIEKAELDELRGGIRERIRLQRADLLKRVQSVLAPVLVEVKAQLQSSPGELSLRLRDVVETVVRPLSHDIGKASKVDAEVGQITNSAAFAAAKSRFPATLSAGSMIVPELLFFSTASIAITANAINFPGAFLQGSVISLLAVFTGYKFLQKALSKVWVPFAIALLLSILSAVAVSFFTEFVLAVFGYELQQYLFWQFVFSQITLTLLTFYMQFLRTQRRDAELEMTRVVSDLAILNSQLRQEVWLNRRRIASILHGSVQAALYASAIRLAKIESPTTEEVEVVQADIAAAISKLESVDGAEKFTDVLDQIRVVWDGAVAVQLPKLSPKLKAQLDSNVVASACAAEIVREAVSNAVKHGKAENVQIQVEQSGQNLLAITVTNDGQPLPAEVEAGYGSSIMDEVAFSWHLENRGGSTVLGATIAI
jgi:signal transduction histidine kinase